MKQLVTITLLYMALPSEYPIDLSLLFFLSVHEKKITEQFLVTSLLYASFHY